MPNKLIKEFIGKICLISVLNETYVIIGKITDFENNWLKVQEKSKIRLINGAMIIDISTMPEKKLNWTKNLQNGDK